MQRSRRAVSQGVITIEAAGIAVEDAKAVLSPRGLLQFMEGMRDDRGNYLQTRPDGTIATIPFESLRQSRHPDPALDACSPKRTQPVSAQFHESVHLVYDRTKRSARSGVPTLSLFLNDQGAALMKSASARLSKPPQYMALFIDGQPIMGSDSRTIAPLVQSEIGAEIEIVGVSDTDTRRLAALLSAPALSASVRLREISQLP